MSQILPTSARELDQCSDTFRLKILIGGRSDGEITLPLGQFSIGRSRRCDLRLLDASVNRIHCVLDRTREEISVTDLNSITGTHVNGKPVRGTWKLDVSDILRVGETRIELVADSTYERGGEAECWLDRFTSSRSRIPRASQIAPRW